MNPEEYEALLIVAGLASYSKYGFKMKPTVWRKFLGGHHFVKYDIAIEFEQKSINLEAYINGMSPSQKNKRKFYIDRIVGTLQNGCLHKVPLSSIPHGQSTSLINGCLKQSRLVLNAPGIFNSIDGRLDAMHLCHFFGIRTPTRHSVSTT
jgi:hypothetical protein